MSNLGEEIPSLNPQDASTSSADLGWSKIRGILGEAEWAQALKAREIVRPFLDSTGLPVYYPGAGDNIASTLAFTDTANDIALVDYVYVNAKGEVDPAFNFHHKIKEMGGAVLSDTYEGKFGEGGKRVIIFECAGRTRKMILYAEDATKFTPIEIQNGIGFAIMFLPTRGQREGSQELPGDLKNFEYLAHLYRSIVVGGFVHWSPVRMLAAQAVGFREILPQPEGEDLPLSLYEKFADVEENVITTVLSMNVQVEWVDTILQGAYGFSTDNLADFETYLTSARAIFSSLPPTTQKELLSSIKAVLIPTVKEGEEDKKNFIEASKTVSFRIFPEIQQI